MPARAGVGFKDAHFTAIEESAPAVGFFEVHAENFMGAGGPPHARLTRLRRDYPLSIHGVGLSVGGTQALDYVHLGRVKNLVERYEPAVFSEHLAWSTHGTSFLNELLPLPYNEATLKCVIAHLDAIQETLGRRILLENPATYLRFDSSVYSEIEFLEEVVRRTGCGLLLDVSNAYACAVNHGFAAEDYIDTFPMHRVEEIHLAGYAEDGDEIAGRLLIDAHCAPISDAVWTLYERALSHLGPVATLIEWDNDVPAWPILMAEATRAESFIEKRRLATEHDPRSEAPHDAVA